MHCWRRCRSSSRQQISQVTSTLWNIWVSYDCHGAEHQLRRRKGKNPDSGIVEIKVGRSSNPVRRLGQWKNQCRSKDALWRGCYPGTVGQDKYSIMGGYQIKEEGGACPFSHRAERLIHLELRDLSESAVYLEKNWVNIDREGVKAKVKKEGQTCVDCQFNILHAAQALNQLCQATGNIAKYSNFHSIRPVQAGLGNKRC